MENGTTIVEKMRKAYADLESYRDTGSVTSFTNPSTGPMKVTFSTHFKRPNLFRFQSSLRFNAQDTTYEVWCDGKAAYSQHSGEKAKRLARFLLDPVGDNEALSTAIANARHPLTACLITPPKFLVPEISSRIVKEFNYYGDESVMEENCYRVQSKSGAPLEGGTFDRELWISRDDLILRKVVEETVVTGIFIRIMSTMFNLLRVLGAPKVQKFSEVKGRSETIITSVELNPKIPDDLFFVHL
jgi:outer membrane lipoprotein-sorting protein